MYEVNKFQQWGQHLNVRNLDNRGKVTPSLPLKKKRGGKINLSSQKQKEIP